MSVQYCKEERSDHVLIISMYGCENLHDVLIILLCVVFAMNAVLVGTAFDVLHHPLSLCSSFLQSMCLQCHRGHSMLSLVLPLSCPCGFSLCVSSFCSTPALVLRSLQSLSLWLPVSVSPSCLFVFAHSVWKKSAPFLETIHTKLWWSFLQVASIRMVAAISVFACRWHTSTFLLFGTG